MTTILYLSILESMERVRAVLRLVLDQAPGSMRELARASGLSHAALYQFRYGKTNLRPESVHRVAGALRTWSRTCGEFADELEQALEADLSEEGGD